MTVEDGVPVFCGCGQAMLAVGDDHEHVYVCRACDPQLAERAPR